MYQSRQRIFPVYRLMFTLASVGALIYFAETLWLQSQASYSQWQLKGAWQASIENGKAVQTWGWPSHWPAAKIRFNSQGKTIYVVEGASEQVLSWGPGHLTQSAVPGENGNAVIFGHNHAHFSVLQQLSQGDIVEAETLKGKARFKVEEMRVAHRNQLPVTEQNSRSGLTLITGYPFGRQQKESQYHYVVRAYRI